MDTLSIVVSVYNSKKSLPLLIERLAVVLPKLATKYEVILINDGGRDNSWSVITNLSQQIPFVRGINLMKNYGQHNALLYSIRQAYGDVIVTMDDDFQQAPEEIYKMVNMSKHKNSECGYNWSRCGAIFC
jgi:glycosyltransferase involved in cell wall biosynthesis